ncbi:MAG: tetraacyldisaccharide 4'-kinase [Parvularculaceae bacterium]
MREPWFWRQHGAAARAAAAALSPLSLLYDSGQRLRKRMTVAKRVGVPIICIGNATLGGAGKTPLSIAVLSLLAERGIRPFFLSRGYGGTLAGPLRVGAHLTSEVGDEPLLLAAHAPVVIARKRVDGACLAARDGAQAIIMDDGYQNPTLVKDVSVLIRSGGVNRRIFPAGPYREPFERAAARADAIVAIDEDCAETDCFGKPLLVARSNLRAPMAPQPVFAFCGIARPERFFSSLEKCGFSLAGAQAFADHHPYAESEIRALKSAAAARGVRLITTEKDFVRLNAEMRQGIAAAGLTLTIDKAEAFTDLIVSKAGLAA